MDENAKVTESILLSSGALQSGHFRLTSGRHSDRYMQCARVFENPVASARLCSMLADKFRDENIQLVAGPALGGVIMAYELARALGVRNIFAEREEGRMTLRRGFAVEPGTRILVAEDVVTTGGSVREVVELLRSKGAEVVAAAAIVDRSNGQAELGVPLKALLTVDVVSWQEEDCPLCREGKPIVKPGSRPQQGNLPGIS